MTTFKCLVGIQEEGVPSFRLDNLPLGSLPPGDVTVSVAFSSLNYKDGLVLDGQANLVASYPIVPGIDFSGIVEASDSADFAAGDHVVATGWGLGERTWGGYAEKARVRSEWLVKLPPEISLQRAMAIGTAGFTSMMAVDALERNGLQPSHGEVAVTGAAGGVGCLAVAILSRLGYRVVAITNQDDAHAMLRRLGAATVLDHRDLKGASPASPKKRWAGAVDCIGGSSIAALMSQAKPFASIAVVGASGGAQLRTTLRPMIQQGVNLLGIYSVEYPSEKRARLWQRLASELPGSLLDEVTKIVPLDAVVSSRRRILRGKVTGRTVVRIQSAPVPCAG